MKGHFVIACPALFMTQCICPWASRQPIWLRGKLTNILILREWAVWVSHRGSVKHSLMNQNYQEPETGMKIIHLRQILGRTRILVDPSAVPCYKSTEPGKTSGFGCKCVSLTSKAISVTTSHGEELEPGMCLCLANCNKTCKIMSAVCKNAWVYESLPNAINHAASISTNISLFYIQSTNSTVDAMLFILSCSRFWFVVSYQLQRCRWHCARSVSCWAWLSLRLPLCLRTLLLKHLWCPGYSSAQNDRITLTV